jgi:hypothetical protein
VCALDDYCCSTEWDDVCVGVGVDSCGADCPVVAGDCCSAGNGAAGCDDATCEDEVCAVDGFCCGSEWDQFCANQALGICEVCGGGSGDCCEANADAGCSDDPCVGLVCGYMGADSGCCNPGPWDQACADVAAGLCEVCGGGPGTGDCCSANPSAGCEDMACNDAVCAVDPFCCNNTWDADCAAEAAGICTLCGSALGDCCSDTGTPGCDDPACVVSICGFDGFDATCCTDQWTQACADEAADVCVTCGAVLPSTCCEAQMSPGCDDATCETDVCGVDTFCCNNTWDGICADLAAGICTTCGGGEGDCCAANGSQGCDEPACVNSICGDVMGADPSCCTDDWAQSCADTAGMVCAGC